ncbi:MAG: hypothetical protein IIY21_18685 [Clostridiales bacterium]|nr:hypothetical protein [Clostridiales bacterium]
MSVEALAREIIDIETRRIAEKIYWEIRRECPKKSGRTARSFRIEKRGDGYAVVSDKLTAYYAENGNGGAGTFIYPKKAKALKITNGVNRRLGFAAYVKAYKGDGFIQRVAARHK